MSYCSIHGKALDENLYCADCRKSRQHAIEYLDKRLNPKTQRDWKNDKSPGLINYLSVCHNCEYFMYHPLRWCARCGMKMYDMKISTKELIEKYGNYKEGF